VIYLIGAFPTGYTVAKLFGVDITEKGSGNVGATNVARTAGKLPGAVTLAGDILKGIIACFVGERLFNLGCYAGFAATVAVMGHCFSLPPILKGGKGVATAFGTALYFAPYAAISACVFFAAIFCARRQVSLSSLGAAFVLPLFLAIMPSYSWLVLPFSIITIVVIYRHKENIVRLAQKREEPFSFCNGS
ncbi:MAG: glycerol-3-phosphate 1-O-acyltransferase, partial [Candidatus Dadabacteria bacterium]